MESFTEAHVIRLANAAQPYTLQPHFLVKRWVEDDLATLILFHGPGTHSTGHDIAKLIPLMSTGARQPPRFLLGSSIVDGYETISCSEFVHTFNRIQSHAADLQKERQGDLLIWVDTLVDMTFSNSVVVVDNLENTSDACKVALSILLRHTKLKLLVLAHSTIMSHSDAECLTHWCGSTSPWFASGIFNPVHTDDFETFMRGHVAMVQDHPLILPMLLYETSPHSKLRNKMNEKIKPPRTPLYLTERVVDSWMRTFILPSTGLVLAFGDKSMRAMVSALNAAKVPHAFADQPYTDSVRVLLVSPSTKPTHVKLIRQVHFCDPCPQHAILSMARFPHSHASLPFHERTIQVVCFAAQVSRMEGSDYKWYRDADNTFDSTLWDRCASICQVYGDTPTFRSTLHLTNAFGKSITYPFRIQTLPSDTDTRPLEDRIQSLFQSRVQYTFNDMRVHLPKVSPVDLYTALTHMTARKTPCKDALGRCGCLVQYGPVYVVAVNT